MSITIYTKNHCPLCDAAKALLNRLSLQYTAHDLSGEGTRRVFLDQHPQIRQMPAVFIDGQYVGGYAGLQAALKQLSIGDDK